MSVSVSMYHSEKFERDGTVPRDIASKTGSEEKILIKYLPDARISENKCIKKEGEIRKLKSEECDTNMNEVVDVEGNHELKRLEGESSNDSEQFRGKVNKDNTSTHSNDNGSLNDEHLDDAEKVVKKTSFSVNDILDPQKFIGCSSNNSRTPVWHPWLNDNVVQDYSKSNLERGERTKGLYTVKPA